MGQSCKKMDSKQGKEKGKPVAVVSRPDKFGCDNGRSTQRHTAYSRDGLSLWIHCFTLVIWQNRTRQHLILPIASHVKADWFLSSCWLEARFNFYGWQPELIMSGEGRMRYPYAPPNRRMACALYDVPPPHHLALAVRRGEARRLRSILRFRLGL
jgi:hypothetical protein